MEAFVRVYEGESSGGTLGSNGVPTARHESPDLNNVLVVPVTAIFLDGVPPPSNSLEEVTLIVGGDNVKYYKYIFDNEDFGDAEIFSVSFPIYIPQSKLTSSYHTVQIIGTDKEMRFWQSIPTSIKWETRPKPPETIITEYPLGKTISGINYTCTRSGRFKFTADKKNCKFIASLKKEDGTEIYPPTVTASPFNFNIPDDGNIVSNYIFEVFAIDIFDLVDPSPAIFKWTIDMTPPVAEFWGDNAFTTKVFTSDTLDVRITGNGVAKYKIGYSINGKMIRNVDSDLYFLKDYIFTISGLKNTDILTIYVKGKNELDFVQEIPTVVTIEVDTTKPRAVIETKTPTPAVYNGVDYYPSNDISLKISNKDFSGENVQIYKYELDGGPMSSEYDVNTLLTFTAVLDKSYTLNLYARDENYIWQDNPTVYIFNINAVMPTIGINNPPASIVNTNSVTLNLSGTSVSYKYRIGLTSAIDSMSYTLISSISTPIIKTGMIDGNYRVDIIGISLSGNETSVVSTSWLLDATAPNAIITNGQPYTLSKEKNLSLTIGGTDVTKYKYALDIQSNLSSSSEYNIADLLVLSSLAEGSHTLYLLGSDINSNWQTIPTTFTWTVDSVPPVTTYTITPLPIAPTFPSTTYTITPDPGSIVVDTTAPITSYIIAHPVYP